MCAAKKPEVAALQDNLLYGLKGLAFYADKARKLGAKDQEIDVFLLEGLFATVTNVDFDPARSKQTIKKCFEMKEKARHCTKRPSRAANGMKARQSPVNGPAAWVPRADLVKQGEQHGINHPA